MLEANNYFPHNCIIQIILPICLIVSIALSYPSVAPNHKKEQKELNI